MRLSSKVWPDQHKVIKNYQPSGDSFWYLHHNLQPEPHLTITKAELLFAQSCLDSSKDFLEFGVSVDVATAIDLAVQQFSSDHLNLQLACGLRCSLSSNFQLPRKLFLQLLLQLSELRGVPSSTAIIKLDQYRGDHCLSIYFTNRQC